jgi:hypothetical protein
MATKDLKFIQEQADGSLIERTINLGPGEVLVAAPDGELSKLPLGKDLGTNDPIGDGVVADLNAEGVALDGSRWKKVGAGNNEWEQILMSGSGTAADVNPAGTAIAAALAGKLSNTVLSQAEAEAGTATTARAFTAERVKQAITALAPAPAAATESANGLTEWATEAEVLAVSDVDAVVRAKHMRIKVETDNGNAISIGDLGGNARGSGSITIQASRALPSQVASVGDAIAIGNNSTASSYYATAMGFAASASSYYATATGCYATASGDSSVAMGYNARAPVSGATAMGYNSAATGNGATAMGYSATASGGNSTASGRYATALGDNSAAMGYNASAAQSCSGAFGHYAKSAVANVQELGYWSGYATRAGAIRVHGTGQTAITAPTTNTAYTASVAANGSEADGSLAQGMLATRLGATNNELITEVNRAGTIAKFSAPRIDSNGAVSIGDLGGDARGGGSITIQASRSSASQVASGGNALAIGNNSTVSGYYATAVGYNATVSGYYATAMGYAASASGSSSTAMGYAASASGSSSTAVGASASAGLGSIAMGNHAAAMGSYATASGRYASASGLSSIAMGNHVTASQSYSGAFGHYVKSAVAKVQELGYWINTSTRKGAVRVHGTGMVAMTIQDRATAYADGGATKGSEADDTVIREGFAIRRNGDVILIDVNIGGTVKTLSLGTAA